jgi:hypothetical protein
MSNFEHDPQPGNPFGYRLIVRGVNPDATDPAEQKQSLDRAADAYRFLTANSPVCTRVTFVS